MVTMSSGTDIGEWLVKGLSKIEFICCCLGELSY